VQGGREDRFIDTEEDAGQRTGFGFRHGRSLILIVVGFGWGDARGFAAGVAGLAAGVEKQIPPLRLRLRSG
jgi:hypothetical protein